MRSDFVGLLSLILFVAWLLGVVGVYHVGSMVHALLALAAFTFLAFVLANNPSREDTHAGE